MLCSLHKKKIKSGNSKFFLDLHFTSKESMYSHVQLMTG